MKTLTLFFAILLVTLSFSCEEDENSGEDKFGQIISLKFGASAEIQSDQLTVQFEKMIEDSRCPLGAECVWEGQARINLLVNNTQNVELIMRAAKEDLARDTLDGLVYILLEVSPYPDLQNELPIAEEDYVIEIQVDEL